MHKLLSVGFAISIFAASELRGRDIVIPQLGKGNFKMEPQAEILSVSRKSLNGKEYSFIKYRDHSDDKAISSIVIDDKGDKAELNQVGRSPFSRVSKGLRDKISRAEKSGSIRICIQIENNQVLVENETEIGRYLGNSDGRTLLNGIQIEKKELIAFNNVRFNKRLAKMQPILEVNRTKLRKLKKEHPFLSSKGFDRALETGSPLFDVELQLSKISDLEKSSETILSIEEYSEPVELLASANIATGVNPNVLNNSWAQGQSIGVYSGETGCPNPGYITDYLRLMGSTTAHSEHVLSILRGVSPKSFIYCQSGYDYPSPFQLAGIGGNPRINVINMSFGYPVDGSNANLDALVDDYVYNNNVTVIAGAGNEGATSSNPVYSPASAFNTVCVGAYDDATNQIAALTSYVNPPTGIEKPEITAPGINVDANGHYGSGTSLSTPIVSGILANKMGIFPQLIDRPALAKAWLITDATDIISGDWGKVGKGGIHWNNNIPYFFWMETANSNWTFLESGDAYPNNGGMDFKFYIESAGNYRATLSWLTRGLFTLQNITAAHPIGIDFDFSVQNASYLGLGGSYSWDDNYEVVDFSVSAPGYHTLRVERYANRDVSCNIRIGIAVTKKN